VRMMPIDVLEVFALYWVTTIGFVTWIIKTNMDLDKKLSEKGEQ
jgi:hypothetical protein